MALNNVNDRTERGLWHGVLPMISVDGKQKEIATVQPKVKVHRNTHFRHSFNYNQYNDHHQLNIMDYVRWLHDKYHEVDYASIGYGGTEFQLNPDANGKNQMKSVNIGVRPYLKNYDRTTRKGQIDENAQYKGHRLSNAVFYRNSSGAGGRDEGYNSSDGFDTLANFMLMYHNNFHLDEGYLQPQLSNPKTKRWVNAWRKYFVEDYHKMYGHYSTAFTFNGLAYDSRNYNNINVHGAKATDNRSSFATYDYDDGLFKDSRKGFADECWHSKGRFIHSVAYQYLHNVRGISSGTLYNLLRTDRVRSYNGYAKYHVQTGVGKDRYKANEKQIKSYNKTMQDWHSMKRQRGFYNAKTKRFYTLLSHHDPMVEFPWYEPVYKKSRLSPEQSSKILKDDPHLRNHPEYRYVSPKDTTDLVKYVPTGDEKVVGADRIYLKSDPSSAQRYPTKDENFEGLTFNSYTRTNGEVDKNMFSRGKQIGKYSKMQYGALITSGTGRDALYVSEDPIDTIGVYDENKKLHKRINATYASIGGVSKKNAVNGILRTLHAQKGEFKDVYLCFDNDPGGHRGTEAIMASEHNKIKFAKNGSSYINPVTHDKQRIHILVPGVHYNRAEHRISKIMPGKLGHYHWKDTDDVLQSMHGLGAYKKIQGTELQNRIRKEPYSVVNISQYSKMIVDNALETANQRSVTGTDNAKHMKRLLNDYDKLYVNVHQQKAPLNMKNKYIKAMSKEYQSMDNVGRTTLMYMMGNQKGNGASDMSPHDLNYYAQRHPEVPVGRDEAKEITSPSHSLGTNIERNIGNTMNLLDDGKDGKSQKLYDLALQSTAKIMPAVQGKVKGAKAHGTLWMNSKFYNYVMARDKNNSFNLFQQDPQRYWQARYSISKCLVPLYYHHPNWDFNRLVKASHKYLQSQGHKPITPKEVFSEVNGNDRPGLRLYTQMNKVQKKYNYHIKLVKQEKASKAKPKSNSMKSAMASQATSSASQASSSSSSDDIRVISNYQKPKLTSSEEIKRENAYVQSQLDIDDNNIPMSDDTEDSKSAKAERFVHSSKFSSLTDQLVKDGKRGSQIRAKYYQNHSGQNGSRKHRSKFDRDALKHQKERNQRHKSRVTHYKQNHRKNDKPDWNGD